MSSPPWEYIAKLVCIGDSGCGKSSLTIRLCEGRFSPHHDVTIGVEFGSRIVPVGPPHSNSLSSTPLSFSPNAAPRPPGSAADTAEQQQQTSKNAAPQKHMKLSLWDTAGQETYKSVTRSYFRGASGALLVFDLSRRQTFEHVTDWLNDLRQIAEPDIVIVLVGNKADLAAGEDESENGRAATSQQQDEDSGGGRRAEREGKREVSRSEAEQWARRNGVLEYVETSAKSGENVERAFMRVAERIYENIQAGRYDLNDRRSGVKGSGAGGAGAGRLRLSAGNQGKQSSCC